jgi:hypothetical protein
LETTTTSERRPRLDLHSQPGHQSVVLAALVERIRLDLVDRGSHAVVQVQVEEAVGVEVGHPDSPDQAIGVDLLHRVPGAVVVPERLVDQVEVEVVQAEPPERAIELPAGHLDAGALDPHLGGDEQVLARDATTSDRATDRGLVAVRRRRVDCAVPDLERIRDRSLRLVLRDLVHAESEDRHADTVVQGHGRDRHDAIFPSGCGLQQSPRLLCRVRLPSG